jgi:hypothetical protein
MKVPVRGSRLGFSGILVLVSLVFSTGNAMAGCRSYAYEKTDAIVFCQMKLKCEVPEIAVCLGQPREWKCRCENPKEDAVKKHEQDIKSGYSVNKNVNKPPSKAPEDK